MCTIPETIRLALIKVLQRMEIDCAGKLDKFKSKVQQRIESIIAALKRQMEDW